MTNMNKMKITDEALENVNGGGLFCDGGMYVEVIDDNNGEVLTKFRQYGDAYTYCKENNLSTKEYSWYELQCLRYGGVKLDWD